MHVTLSWWQIIAVLLVIVPVLTVAFVVVLVVIAKKFQSARLGKFLSLSTTPNRHEDCKNYTDFLEKRRRDFGMGRSYEQKYNLLENAMHKRIYAKMDIGVRNLLDVFFFENMAQVIKEQKSSTDPHNDIDYIKYKCIIMEMEKSIRADVKDAVVQDNWLARDARGDFEAFIVRSFDDFFAHSMHYEDIRFDCHLRAPLRVKEEERKHEFERYTRVFFHEALQIMKDFRPKFIELDRDQTIENYLGVRNAVSYV